MERKAKMNRKKSEITSLLRAVENNIHPSEFRNRVGEDKPTD
jgi:hypothetical protein